MFGVSFGELVLIATVALLVVGPQKLPGMLRTLGTWLARARRVMTEVRSQSGIDDILRSEGLEGGLNELRSIVRGAGALPLAARTFQATAPARRAEPFLEDRTREYPPEGPDSYGALPEDLLGEAKPAKPAPAEGAPPPAMKPAAAAAEAPTASVDSLWDTEPDEPVVKPSASTSNGGSTR